MGASDINGAKDVWASHHAPQFDHPQNAFYSQLVRSMFSFLNNSWTKQDTHHDGALLIVMFSKIDLVGQSCGAW
jgi:hypothetical protein